MIAVVVLSVLMQQGAATPALATSDSSLATYERAKALFETRAEGDLRESLLLFERAVTSSPNFAKAHAGIADAACLLALYGYAPASDLLPKARAAAERAIALDDGLAEAHAALGLTRYLYEWKWADAETRFRRAIALDPSYATVRHWFAMMLMVSGRYPEALEQIDRAIALEPGSPLYQTKRGTILIAAGRLEEAESHLAEVVARFETFAMARRELGRIALARGETEAALARFEDGTPDRGVALARLGRTSEAREVLAQLATSPTDAAIVHAALGEKEQALRSLEQALAEHDPSLVYVRELQGLASIRSESRYQAVERAVVPGLRIAVRFPVARSTEPLDGRLLLMISNDPSKEPRFQIVDGAPTQIAFGVDVDGWQPGEDAVFDARVLGYPLDSLADVPPGRYRVQALLHKYETFHRADGHVVKLPMDRGEGQQWNLAPGNLYNLPVEMDIDPSRTDTLRVEIDQEIPPIPEAPETKYIKHVRIQSKLLSDFWGRPMFLGAHVLLPEGFDEHPDARYPLMILHGHFPHDFGGFREEPPDPDLEPEYSERFRWEGYNRTVQEYAHAFYTEWTGPDFPRVLAIEIQHANPYYDDSYAVNSENLGPYGDAITHELIPHIEERFRGIGEGWARFLYGGSTGGWEALAAQVFYPDEYNGCFAACPDPIDFRAYTVVNLYEDTEAYYTPGPFTKTARPGHRDYLGHIRSLLDAVNRRELVLGTKSRSGQQWDIWEAVYSPVGDDGYPQRIWDKRTGVIDKEVASFWRENYDLSYIMKRDWATLGPKLEGKVHIYVGDMDNFYLNNAVYLTEEFLESTTSPYYGGEVDYGDRAEHCWNGDHTRPNGTSRLRYHQMFIPKAVERMLESAPEGADLTSWRY